MANERDSSFKCVKISLIVIHSLVVFIVSIVLIGSIVVLAESDEKSPEEKDRTRKFMHNNSWEKKFIDFDKSFQKKSKIKLN